MFSSFLEALSRLPLGNGISLLLALGIAGYTGWSLRRSRRRGDLFFLLLGLYLAGLQMPLLFSVLAGGSATCPLGGSSEALLRLAPAAVLFALAVLID